MNKLKAKRSAKTKLRMGDQVIVIAGKSKGQKGKILSVIPARGRVLVEGVNLATKAVRPNPQLNIEGGLITRELSLDASNVAILNPDTQKADRIGYTFDEKGLKTRVFRSSGKPVPYTISNDE